jgi:hypothetical protein
MGRRRLQPQACAPSKPERTVSDASSGILTLAVSRRHQPKHAGIALAAGLDAKYGSKVASPWRADSLTARAAKVSI